MKEKIEEKKKQLAQSAKPFTPKTNCSLELAGTRFNLHVSDKPTLTNILLSLNSMRLSAIDLGMVDIVDACGFKLTDWIDDVKMKLMIVDRKNEEARLKVMEQKLESLMSEDKRVELELEKIVKEFG